MQLERKPGFISGIKCDICAAEHENDFSYSSADAREVCVINNATQTPIPSLPVIFSFDICDNCISRIKELIKVNYLPTRSGVNCDLCGLKMRGDFSYYYVNLSLVNVSLYNSSVRCNKCNSLISVDSQCACGGQPVRIAVVDVDDKYLQMSICSSDYESMVKSAASLRQSNN